MDIPFPSPRGAQPGQLTYGIAPGPPAYAAPHTPGPVFTGSAFAAGPAAFSGPAPVSPARPTHRKRRASFSDEDPDAKRLTVRSSGRALPTLAHASPTDFGRALSALSKEQLVAMLGNVVGQNPEVQPLIAACMPTPSLEFAAASITEHESRVLQAMPVGHNMRPEYVWSRVRLALEEYALNTRSVLQVFCSYTNAVAPQSSDDEVGHPATTFNVLHALTGSIRRMEAQLPFVDEDAATINSISPIVSHLLPVTLNAWHIFLTRLSAAVNSEGRILAAFVVRSWFSRLDELCVDTPNQPEGKTQPSIEKVRDRMRAEIGWLVGIAPRP